MNKLSQIVPLVLVLILVMAGATLADVSYTEEVVNSGVGSKKRGARRTVHEIHIKGGQQCVSTDIETSKAMAGILRKQGVTLRGTKILRLDQGRLYEIDRDKETYRREALPAVPASPGAGKRAAPKIQTQTQVQTQVPSHPNREISVRTKALKDTLRVAGVLCHRVAVEMTARHFKPGTKTVQRVHRYLYQAWMADGFPGYKDITAFRKKQEQTTSLAPLIRGGLEQLADSIEDPERLQSELALLQGFPMQSELKVYSKVGKGRERQLLRLSRKVLSLSQKPLSDALFRPSRKLKSIP